MAPFGWPRKSTGFPSVPDAVGQVKSRPCATGRRCPPVRVWARVPGETGQCLRDAGLSAFASYLLYGHFGLGSNLRNAQVVAQVAQVDFRFAQWSLQLLCGLSCCSCRRHAPYLNLRRKVTMSTPLRVDPMTACLLQRWKRRSHHQRSYYETHFIIPVRTGNSSAARLFRCTPNGLFRHRSARC